MSKVRFSFLTGDVNWSKYGGKWISQKISEDQCDYWLVKELDNLQDTCGNDTKRLSDYDSLARNLVDIDYACDDDGNRTQPKYYCKLSKVAPSQFEDLEIALVSYGIDADTETVSDHDKVEAIVSYSNRCIVWQGLGNNYSELFKDCQGEADALI